jgi:hypothetical protein
LAISDLPARISTVIALRQTLSPFKKDVVKI